MGSYLKTGQDVVITETNVSGLETSALRLAKNDEVSELVEGRDFTIDPSDEQVGWSQYTYTIPAKQFRDDAYYRVMLASRDFAGNFSENLMFGKNETRDAAFEVNFAVDGTAPIASLSNVDSNAMYYAPSQRVDVFMSDNMEADKAVLIVNKARVAQWSSEELADSRSFSYELPAAEEAYSVQVEVKDKAGNTTTTQVKNIVVTNNWLRYILNTPSILYPLVAGSILGIGLVGIIVSRILFKRHKKKIKAAA